MSRCDPRRTVPPPLAIVREPAHATEIMVQRLNDATMQCAIDTADQRRAGREGSLRASAVVNKTLWMPADRRGGRLTIQATDDRTPVDGGLQRLHVGDDRTAREFVEKSM
jgi:hypothetical protein